MQNNSAVKYLPALLRNAMNMETMGGEKSWRHIDTTVTGVDIFVEGPMLGVGRELYMITELIPQTRPFVPGHFHLRKFQIKFSVCHPGSNIFCMTLTLGRSIGYHFLFKSHSGYLTLY